MSWSILISSFIFNKAIWHFTHKLIVKFRFDEKNMFFLFKLVLRFIQP
jgi:hypothetical protein